MYYKWDESSPIVFRDPQSCYGGAGSLAALGGGPHVTPCAARGRTSRQQCGSLEVAAAARSPRTSQHISRETFQELHLISGSGKSTVIHS